MPTYAPPVARCTRTVELPDGRLYPCEGWVSGYVIDPEESKVQVHTLTCGWCAEEYIWRDFRLVQVGTRQVQVGGRLVRVQRGPGDPTPWPEMPRERPIGRPRGRPRTTETEHA